MAGQVNISAGGSIKSEVTDNLSKRYNRLVYAYEQLSLALEINKVPRITGAEDARVEIVK